MSIWQAMIAALYSCGACVARWQRACMRPEPETLTKIAMLAIHVARAPARANEQHLLQCASACLY